MTNSFRILALISLTIVTQCQAQDANTKYRFNSAFAQDDDSGLLHLANDLWSKGTDPNFALVCAAAAAFRANELARCSSLLDSCDVVIPVDQTWLRSIIERIRCLQLSSLGAHERAARAAKQGLDLQGIQDLPEERTALLVVLAEAEIGQGHLDIALGHLQEAERLSISIDFKRGLGLVAAARGAIHYHRENYDSAWKEYSNALNIAVTGDFSRLASAAISNLGSIAIMTERYDLAVHLFDSLLVGSHLLDAGSKAHALNHLAFAYAAQGEHQRALKYLRASLELKSTSGEEIGRAEVLQNIAYSLWGIGREEPALDTMRLALRITQDLQAEELQYGILWDLMLWHKQRGRSDSALNYLITWADVSESLQLEKHGKEVANAEVLFETERKERHIVEQDQALLLTNAESQKKSLQRNILIGSTLLLTLIALLLFRTIRTRKRLAGKEKELHDEQVDQLLSQQEIKSINAMLEGQENERDRMAKDLHDRLGSMLGGIKANMAALEDRVEQVQKDQQFVKVNRLLDQAVGELRQISHDMAAATLSRFGLEKALKDLRDTIHINGRLSVELNVFGLEQSTGSESGKRLDRSVELAVYRMVQELVSNVLKHAQARELSIAVTRSPGRLSVVVSDDGKGFDTSLPAEGMGLSNVRSRASALGATVQVDSTPGKGTTVSVECPVVE